jgi:hypothetical protein
MIVPGRLARMEFDADIIVRMFWASAGDQSADTGHLIRRRRLALPHVARQPA